MKRTIHLVLELRRLTLDSWHEWTRVRTTTTRSKGAIQAASSDWHIRQR